MDMPPVTRKELLEKYSTEEGLSKLDQLSQKEKEELLFAIGGENMLQKAGKFNRDRKVIKHLCSSKLQTLFLIKHQEENNPEKVEPKNYKKEYNNFVSHYQTDIQEGYKKGEIFITNHIFEHVISDLSKYKSGSLAEKMKYARGLAPHFFPKNWQQGKEINKKYLTLDPEKVDLSIISFLRTEQKEEKKFSPEEELFLKNRLLQNHDSCKEILFAYEPLVLPKDGGYQEKTTERIVALTKNGKKIGYLVSENIPVRYSEKHLRKYRGNEFSFEVFSTKEQLMIYLKNQLDFIKQQRERFNQAITYFTVMDPKAEDKDSITPAHLGFSTHGTYTDQIITEKINQLIRSTDERGRRQIVEAIVNQARRGIKESEIKEQIMRDHYNALFSNHVF